MNQRLWAEASDDLDFAKASSIVEASVRPTLWDCQGDYVETRGLRFRYAANAAQQAAARFAGRGDVVED